MIDVCLLGTGGMMPLPYRYLTALMVRYNGKGIMIDCGEGTQVANAERTEPLYMAGPKGLERVVGALRTIAPELPFEIRFRELREPEETIELAGEKIITSPATAIPWSCPGPAVLTRRERWNWIFPNHGGDVCSGVRP